MAVSPIFHIFFIFMWVIGLPLIIYAIFRGLNRPKLIAEEKEKFDLFISLKARSTPEQATILQRIDDDRRYGKSYTDIFIALQNEGIPLGRISDAVRAHKELISGFSQNKR